MSTYKLTGYISGGYSACIVKKIGKRYSYVSHDSGAKKRWAKVIAQLNAGDNSLSYVTASGDCFDVKIVS